MIYVGETSRVSRHRVCNLAKIDKDLFKTARLRDQKCGGDFTA